MRQKFLFSVFVVTVLIIVGSIVASAATNNEAFESERFYTGRTDGTFSLIYQGQGCPATNDSNDYRFRINVNRSFPGSDWKYYSNNSYYQRTPSGRPIYGFQLDNPNAYVCIGYKEFSRIFNPLSAWSVSGVQQNVYTWRR